MERIEHVSISKENVKVGYIQSVSLPPGVTCSECAKKTCLKQKCYALKIYKLRPTVKSAYDRNLRIYTEDNNKYWREVEAAVMVSTAFRFHVGGDIVDSKYLENMIRLANKYPVCQMLCFTKKFELVNEWIGVNGPLPDNLHLIFSAWRGIEMNNPYNLPECHIFYKDGYTTLSETKPIHYCSENCTDCLHEKKNCFCVKNGEQILIKEH